MVTFLDMVSEMEKVVKDHIDKLKETNDELEKQIFFHDIYCKITDSIKLSKQINFQELFNYSKDKQENFDRSKIKIDISHNLEQINLLENKLIPVFDEIRKA